MRKLKGFPPRNFKKSLVGPAIIEGIVIGYEPFLMLFYLKDHIRTSLIILIQGNVRTEKYESDPKNQFDINIT
jgi:hypothetical protein